jgi:hypothetical protein
MPTRYLSTLRVGLLESNNLSQANLALPTHQSDFGHLIKPKSRHKKCSTVGMTHNTSAIAGQIAHPPFKSSLMLKAHIAFFRCSPVSWHNPAMCLNE